MKKILIILMTVILIAFCGCVDDADVTDENKENIVKDNIENKPSNGDDEQMTEANTVVEPAIPNDVEISEDMPEDTDVPEDTFDVPAEVEPPQQTETVAPPAVIGVTEIKLSVYSVSVTVGEKKMPIVTMYPQNATNKNEIWTSSNNDVATVDGIGNIKGIAEGDCTVTVTSVDNPDVSATVSVTVTAVPECTYIDGILIVNKTYALPASYAPGWETEASGPLWEMIAAAKKDGIKLWMTSGYRSYYDQQYIYNGYVKRDGQEEADTYSARPGHSEHQTGLAYDLNDLDLNFGDTPEGQWVAENCHKYGFILRYPKGKEDITGYIYEPWHIRYLGVEKATEVYESGLCLEEFLNITSKYAE